jgi:hypothetical protein
MALKGTGPELGDKIAEIITAGDAPPEKKAAIKQLWEDIGTVIVNHFLEKTVVKVESGIAVSTPVGPGATSAPGTGGLT